MTCVVVNDASCLIDLRKGRLLEVLCRLPCRFVVPLPIRESELLAFTPHEWTVLDRDGMGTHDLPPPEGSERFNLVECEMIGHDGFPTRVGAPDGAARMMG